LAFAKPVQSVLKIWKPFSFLSMLLVYHYYFAFYRWIFEKIEKSAKIAKFW